MKKLLCIDANPKKMSDSYSRRLSQHFIENYKKKFPEDTVVIKNLYDSPPPFLTSQMIKEFFSPENTPSKRWAEEFKGFDRYVIVSPTWNFSIPGILKTYLDLIIVLNKTFTYDEEKNIVGLLKNKKMAIITSAGDSYSTSENMPYEMNHRYLKKIFFSLGIENIKHFGIEGTILQPERAIAQSVILMKEIEQFLEKVHRELQENQ